MGVYESERLRISAKYGVRDGKESVGVCESGRMSESEKVYVSECV